MSAPRGRGRPAKRIARGKGRGSIRELEAGKLYQLRLPSIDGQDGATRRFHGTEAQAHEALDAWVTERTGTGYTGKMPTLGEYAQTYIDVYSANSHNPKHHADRSYVVRTKVIAGPMGKMPLDQIREHHVEAWLMSLAKAGLRQNTINGYRAALNSVMSWAVARRVIVTNPVTNAVKPNKRLLTPKRDIAFLSLADAHKLVAHCQSDPDTWGPYVITSALLGLRPGEACGLRWQDVDIDGRLVHVRHALVRINDRPLEVGDTKTPGSVRSIDMPDQVALALKRQRAYLDEYAGVGATDAAWADLVFPRDGKPPYMSTVRKALDKVCSEAGVPRLTPYSLRHSCASILLDADISEERVARMLGTSVEMLRAHYRHWLDPVARGGAAVWNDLI